MSWRPQKPYTASGLARVFAGDDAAAFFGTSPGDRRRAGLYGLVQHGVVYTSKLRLRLGLDPDALQAVQAEHTPALPIDNRRHERG